MTGGGRGIRTPDTLSGSSGFQDRRHQPLGHPSVRITPIVPDYAERFIRRLRRFTQIHLLGSYRSPSITAECSEDPRVQSASAPPPPR